jgi:hypothetical protein
VNTCAPVLTVSSSCSTSGIRRVPYKSNWAHWSSTKQITSWSHQLFFRHDIDDNYSLDVYSLDGSFRPNVINIPLALILGIRSTLLFNAHCKKCLCFPNYLM